MRLWCEQPRLEQVRRVVNVTTVCCRRPPIPQQGVPASVAVTVAPRRPRRSPHPDPDDLQLGMPAVPVSATLAANEAMDERRRRGEPVLPMAFGEAGLPAHPLLREALEIGRAHV